MPQRHKGAGVADLKKTIEILFEGNDQASRKAADVIGKLQEMERAAKTASLGTDQVDASLEKIGKAGPALGIINAALAAFSAKALIDSFIDANVAVEKFETGIKAVQGSSTDTGAQLAYVRDVANRLGLDVGATATAFLQLTAATQGTTLQGRATREVFEAVATAMGALGKSSSETEGAFKAIEQIVSKGKVSMEELRGQLGDRLPGALQIAARAMGVTTTEFEALVKSGLSAEAFLPAFAAELNKTFAGATFDGYLANLNRLRNAVDELLVQAGRAGLFEALTSGVRGATGFLKEAELGFTALGGQYEAVARLIRNGDWEAFGRDLDGVARKAQIMGAALDFDVNQSLAETSRLLRQSKEAATDSADQFDAETQRLLRQSGDAARAVSEVDALLKRLGVDPKKTIDGIGEIAQALEALAANPRTNGADFALAFATSLKKAGTTDQVVRLGEVLATAFAAGKISSEAYNASLKSLSEAFDKLDGTTKKAKDAADEHARAMERQAAEARKAEQESKRLAVELEKIASNERIKNIETKVKLNVAEVEAQTKRVQAAFESINNTVSSTGDLIGDLFGLLKDYDNLNFAAIRAIEKQIETENARRQQALDLQKQLIEAQVANLKAQTRAIDKGDSIIKVDGAGLQPHLEAFMWEILRQIQIRVNQDGLKLLLGA